MPSPTRLALQGLDLGHDGMFIRGLGLIRVEHNVSDLLTSRLPCFP